MSTSVAYIAGSLFVALALWRVVRRSMPDPKVRRLLAAAREFQAPEPLPSSTALEVVIRPQEPQASTYEFLFRNTDAATLLNISANIYDLLGPGDFGLDDTHMPVSLTREPMVLIERLPPGAEVAVVRKRWGPLARYRGLYSTQLAVWFTREGESQRGFSVNVKICA